MHKLATRHREFVCSFFFQIGKYMVPTYPIRTDKILRLFQYFFNVMLLFFFLNDTWFILAVNLNTTKNNIFLKFPEFSSILCDFPRLFQSVQNSMTGKCLPIFPGLPIRVETLGKQLICPNKYIKSTFYTGNLTPNTGTFLKFLKMVLCRVEVVSCS